MTPTPPAEFGRWIKPLLPVERGNTLVITVKRRDAEYRVCQAWQTVYFEVQAYYTWNRTEWLNQLEAAFRQLPGIHVTTQVRPRAGDREGRVDFTNPEWPATLGTNRPGRKGMRSTVLALMRADDAVQGLRALDRARTALKVRIVSTATTSFDVADPALRNALSMGDPATKEQAIREAISADTADLITEMEHGEYVTVLDRGDEKLWAGWLVGDRDGPAPGAAEAKLAAVRDYVTARGGELDAKTILGIIGEPPAAAAGEDI